MGQQEGVPRPREPQPGTQPKGQVRVNPRGHRGPRNEQGEIVDNLPERAKEHMAGCGAAGCHVAGGTWLRARRAWSTELNQHAGEPEREFADGLEGTQGR